MELELEELKSSVEAGVKEEKATRTAATQGGKYKLQRSPFQSLDEKGLLTPDNIVKEFALVQNKKQH